MPTEDYICAECDELDKQYGGIRSKSRASSNGVEIEETMLLELNGRILDHREESH